MSQERVEVAMAAVATVVVGLVALMVAETMAVVGMAAEVKEGEV